MSHPRQRLILADDHHLLVDGLKRSLGRRWDIVAVAYSGEELLQQLRPGLADCLLLDLSMPGRNGLDLLPDIFAAAPDIKVLVVTMHLDRVIADAVLHAGAHGFIPKDCGLGELEDAIRRVLEGEIYLSPRVPNISYRMGMAAHAGLALLTPRQHAILALIADGCTSGEIARRLGCSERTITFHRQNIRARLGIDSERSLMRFAILACTGAPRRTAKRTPEDG